LEFSNWNQIYVLKKVELCFFRKINPSLKQTPHVLD